MEISIKQIKNVYAEDEWIVEGSANYLIEPGINKADIILYLAFCNVILQWAALIKRHWTRKNETLLKLLKLLRHVFYKRYKLGYVKQRIWLPCLIEPYKDKIIYLYNHKEIDDYINNSK